MRLGEVEFYKVLLAALVPIGAAYFHQLWKYSRDAYQARVDEACKLIFELADDGAEYWSKAKRPPQTRITKGTSEPSESRAVVELLELQIAGHVNKLLILRLILRPRLGFLDGDQLDEKVATFQDAMTGGDFGSAARAADRHRAKQIYEAASDLVAHLRAGADRGNRWWRIVFRDLHRLIPYRVPTSRSGRIEDAIWLSIIATCLLVGGFLAIASILDLFVQLLF